ncbi:beta-N-acetylhexosaminidase [Agriterribacter humi]|uniref:beta-N-acetylhexosaminidase n=1 Tax=Agriterribacter humi TaxID=1104781 RepID=UPI001264DE7D|nr:family 20 glycosylhydrolase [Agriterribacter humi]
MKYLLALAILFVVIPCFSQNATTAIIPEPVSIVQKQGVFTLQDNISISIPDNHNDAAKVANYLSHAIAASTGYKSSIKNNGNTGHIHFIIAATPDKELGDEGYNLVVSPETVTLTANTAAGLFYGVQTFLQLLPKEITSKSVIKDVTWMAPCVEIRDYPRFGWRGLMFDVSRHFFTKEEVKEFIDDMAKYKFNLLHMHLTDDQGWRIEIKSLPKLTSTGAWNVKKTGTFNTFSAPEPDEPRNYGGFYTHEDIKEIIQYAKDQFINILPEVDIPGHSLAAIASYPELSCTPRADKYKVNSGEPFMVWPPGGHFYGLVDNTLCPANEKVYEFLDKVFTEVAQLFPFEYIHMGGDETARNFWEKSAAIKTLMKKEKLKNLDEVQSYFVKRVEKIIESKGKKMIGWDEILQGGLAPNAAVMSWRGIKGGIEAAKQKHEVVMSPTTFAYLDYMQGDAATEPPVYATLRLSKAYEFEPVPEGVDPVYIKGGQANLWTEQVYNMRHLQYMLWPRAFAIAESVWSPKAKKNWNNFVARVEKQFERFDIAEIKYSPAIYDPIITVKKDEKNLPVVEMNTEASGLAIFYSFDNSFPDKFYPKYTQPVSVPKDAATMKVITYRDGKPIGRMMAIPVSQLKKKAGVK